MRRPLVISAVFYTIGILAAYRFQLSLFWLNGLAAAGVLLGFLCLKNQKAFCIVFSCFVFFLGMAALRNAVTISKTDISRFVEWSSTKPYVVRGFIAHKPLLKDHKATFLFQTQFIKSADVFTSCSGQILVSLKTKQGFVYAEELILRGQLRQLQFFGRGVRLRMQVKTDADCLRLRTIKGFWLKRCALALADKMEQLIFRYIPSPVAGILDAMILGEKRHLPGFINTLMMKTGTLHILVVSGFNVGIVSLISWMILKSLRVPRPWRYGLMIICLVLYCFMTGACTPVVRATIMASCYILGILARKEPDIHNSFALAWLFILLWNPLQLFEAGFQLSFASVAALIYAYPKLRAICRIRSLRHKVLKFLAEAFLVSFSCWMATAGLIIHYFQIFSPVTVLANIGIVPLATLITLCGFCFMGIASVCPALAPVFANTCILGAMLLIKANALLSSLPFACLTVQWQS